MYTFYGYTTIWILNIVIILQDVIKIRKRYRINDNFIIKT